MVEKIVSCAADSILEVFLGKVNQQAAFLRTVFSSFPSCTSAFLCAMAKQRRAPSLAKESTDVFSI
jgi:hypothetical protein